MPERRLTKVGGAESTPTTVRKARISWLTNPPRGHAKVSLGSRAFAALPMAMGGSESEPRVTDAGELMAAAHGSVVAAILAEVLVGTGTPAQELVVSVTYAFAGDWFALTEQRLHVEGRVRDCTPQSFERAALEAVKRCGEAFGAPEHPKLTISTRLR